jgi:cysteine desulfurase family protein
MNSDQEVIYLDNAATSWPKPDAMLAAMADFNQNIGANPGRSGHRLSVDAARVVYGARERLARLLNAPDELRVLLTANVTEALNLALAGLLRPGMHAVTSSMEHNSVMRPLRALQREGVELSVVPCSPAGELHPDDVKRAIKKNTRLIALNHASNVVGTRLPLREVGIIAREHGVLLLADCAQTAGAYPLDMRADYIDLLAFTGHKGLYGPMGTGGLVLGERVDIAELNPLKRGGTGSLSEEEEQPDFAPDKYESGTANAIGLAGLSASLDWLAEKGVEAIQKHERVLANRLIKGLEEIEGARVYGTLDAARQSPVVSFTIDGLDNGRVGQLLDERYGILCRVGLHCAPAAHRTMGTFPDGTVRLGLGIFNTAEQVETVLEAVREIAAGRRQS